MMTYQLVAVILADSGGLLLLPVGLLAFAFWIWMIVDCAKHETEGTTKIVWLLIIILAGIIGAPLYFFVRKAPRQKHAQYQATARVYQPWKKDQKLK
jgi:thiol:disulfide interchange protein